MSHLSERSPQDQETDSATMAARENQGCRVLALPKAAEISFDTLETQFFTEGEALNAAPAFGGEAWDEPTVICGPRHRKKKQYVRWIALSAASGILCACLFLWYASRTCPGSIHRLGPFGRTGPLGRGCPASPVDP
jgi:hypothetical protein